MIDAGFYNFKIIESTIKVNKRHQKYISLKLEVQGGDYEGAILHHNFIPWNEFNWMHNIKSIFTEFDIETYMLEYSDEDTVWVVAQLALGEFVSGKVTQERAHLYGGIPYNLVFLKSKAVNDRVRTRTNQSTKSTQSGEWV